MTPASEQNETRIIALKISPEVPNQVWARRWGVSRERVRQLRAEAGLPALDLRRQFSAEVAKKVLTELRKGLSYGAVEELLCMTPGTVGRWQQRYPAFARQLREVRVALKAGTTKVCRICGETKPRSEFYPVRGSRGGVGSRCRDCSRERAKRWARERPDVLEPTRSVKRCPRCKQFKPASAFYRNKRSHDGLGTYCKSCDRERDQERARARVKQ